MIYNIFYDSLWKNLTNVSSFESQHVNPESGLNDDLQSYNG